MLSEHEQRVWDDIERYWAEEAPEPRRSASAPRDPSDPPALVVAGIWGAILLIIFGVTAAGLSVGAVTAVGWALWRYRPRPGRTGPPVTESVLEEITRGLLAARRPAEQARPWQQRRRSQDG
jgi:hypothetical protein